MKSGKEQKETILFVTRVCSVLTNHTSPTTTALIAICMRRLFVFFSLSLTSCSCAWRTESSCMTNKEKLTTESLIEEKIIRLEGPVFEFYMLISPVT